jgi:SAM-dependent methyltransferase
MIVSAATRIPGASLALAAPLLLLQQRKLPGERATSSMSESKRNKMAEFWSARARLYGRDPRANTSDIWLRELEINCASRVIQEGQFETVMDFGCANGYTTRRLAKLHGRTRFIGFDINQEMIAAARRRVDSEPLSNIEFRLSDIRTEEPAERFSFIYAIRVFQNMEDLKTQKNNFDILERLSVSDGMLLCIESYLDGYITLNNDRITMGLPPLPIHEHLTLLTDEFDEYASSKMPLVRKEYLSSSYYLVTRLLYSYLAKINDEPIDYNHPIHQIAALLPQIGEYGPQRANLYRKS